MAYQSFEDLEVWQRGCRLSVSIFQTFDGCKNFTFVEGSERGSTKDFAHFLNFSKGSCGELRTQLYIARKLKLLNKPDFETSIAETKEISAMLEGLRRSMLAKTRPKLKRSRRKKLKA